MTNGLTTSQRAAKVATALAVRPGDVIEDANLSAMNKGKFVVVNQVTRSVLSQRDYDNGDPWYVTIETKATNPEPEFDEKGKEAQPPSTCNVINLVTGELQYMVMNIVLMSEIDRGYPDASYVGKSFAIAKVGEGGSKIDRRYKTYRVLEIAYHEDTNELKSAGKPVIAADTPEAIERAKDRKSK